MELNSKVAAGFKLSDGKFLDSVCKRLRNTSVKFAELERDVLHELEVGGTTDDVLIPLKALIGRIAWEAYRTGHTDGTARALAIRPQSVVQPV